VPSENYGKAENGAMALGGIVNTASGIPNFLWNIVWGFASSSPIIIGKRVRRDADTLPVIRLRLATLPPFNTREVYNVALERGVRQPITNVLEGRWVSVFSFVFPLGRMSGSISVVPLHPDIIMKFFVCPPCLLI
jgi:hypothetical protein